MVLIVEGGVVKGHGVCVVLLAGLGQFGDGLFRGVGELTGEEGFRGEVGWLVGHEKRLPHLTGSTRILFDYLYPVRVSLVCCRFGRGIPVG